MNNLVQIDNLEKNVDDFHLGPINLNMEAGTITTLIGNNGSGKSTLLKLMMDLAKPDQGNVRIKGKFVYGLDEDWKENVAYLPQTQIGFDVYTGADLRSLIAPLYKNWDDTLFDTMIETFKIPLHKKYSKLSQGMQQKLNLALTLPRNAPILLLDEPTNFMDIPSKRILVDLLAEYIESEDRVIFIASHQVEDIKRLADYLVVLRSGELVGQFEKEALKASYRKYWLNAPLQTIETNIPGIIHRTDSTLISNDPSATEAYLIEEQMKWNEATGLELEEIIDLLLK